jgi:hypothetical protein
MLPLYEAKMVHHYDHRWATYESSGVVRDVTVEEKCNPDFVVMPRYWLAAAEVDNKTEGRQWFVGWREVCRSTDERTVICAKVPRTAVGHKFMLALAERDLSSVESNLASLVLDFVARQKIGGTAMGYFLLKQLPILPPGIYEEPSPWDLSRSVRDWILGRMRELSYTARDAAVFVQNLGIAGEPFLWNEQRRSRLRSDLDAAYFHLYDIKRNEVDHILDQFPIVRRNDEQRFTEFRTKSLILETYDAMAQAIATGTPYQTVLDPAPGHGPRHPVRRDRR